ncbi:hypothetical protein OG562_39920 [Streptomyces sp. NBC_01275]|uniref:hypothetical protein n=1 Tax=Streptomyces sp. NBC_01275 TaxID=2903807 RepID=UPI00224D8C1A|nr:hypothetical protein [Streptomyces sp. NBC_01275]MCX4767030.1 hypothetical protein [Streptomyces sp. NBC_01275]
MRRGFVAVLAALVAAVGCGAEGGEGVVVEGTPPATPYSGPLNVPTRELDENTPEALLVGSGAAGRALECAGEIFEGGGPDGWSRGDGGDSPEQGLRVYFDMFDPSGPRSGYRVERRETDRVLYSFDVGGRTKVAVVVAKDQENRPGWGPETHASCDPAELPARFTDSGRVEIWTDRSGERVPTTSLSSYAGAEHCDWQDVHFLGMGRGEGYRQYVRDPGRALEGDLLTSPYDGDVPMPADAHDTGYRYRDWRLWLTEDRTTAYVRTPEGVEAWPLAKERVACM